MNQNDVLKKYFNILEIKRENSTLHGEKSKWLNRLEDHTYMYVKQMYESLYSRIYSLRSRGITDTSLDLEMIALGLFNVLLARERDYSSQDYEKYPSLKQFDEILKKVTLKTLELNVHSIEDVIDYPMIEDVLEGFMKEEDLLNEKLRAMEIGG